MITNDLFDINTDKIERPSRPLASGKIKVSMTILLAILFFWFWNDFGIIIDLYFYNNLNFPCYYDIII